MSSPDSGKSPRLPAIVLPKHYDLVYSKIDLEKHAFEGQVSLHCTALQSLDVVAITLHAVEIHLVHATLSKKDGSTPVVEAEQFRYNGRHQTCEIVFGGTAPDFFQKDDKYMIKMDFHGSLNDQMRGFYRSTYHALDGKTKIMATTQFEPTDARRAFPCFDEPALKATFCLTLTIPGHLQCISNTPMAATVSHYQQNGSFTKTVKYQKTPQMSTYLLAMIIGEFDAISDTSRQVVTTVYTCPGKASQGQFCLDLAVRCLDYYQDLFGVPYPLVKSDLVAIPDFAAGAMENWGCVTYREAKVLVSEGHTSETTRRGIARTLCHELAHQWFGNLVTMDWWTQLYLKEGMARFMEFVGINHLFPEWNAWVEFVQSVYGLALSLDSMKSSHPVEVEVRHPEEINQIFDAISYAKGASIVRMIASFVGMDTFFKGMRLYLERHQYGNAVTVDLWRALEEVSGKPVIKFMSPWTKQVGFPIVQVANDGSLEITRFLGSGPEDDPSATSRWPIPVTARVQGEDQILGPWVIHGPDGDQSAELAAKIKDWTASEKWFKLNVDQTAFFRVSYTPEQWRRLATVMNPDTSPLSTTDRLGLISDSFAAGRAGYSPIVDSLSLASKFGVHETVEYAVWQELSESLSALASLFRSEPFFPKIQAYLKSIYSHQLARLGWKSRPDEPSRTGTLRATVIGLMGVSGDKDVLQHAYDQFMAYKRDPVGSPIDGDVRMAIFRSAMRHDEATVLQALKEIFENKNTSPEEKRNCLVVMGSVKDNSLHSEVLDYVFWSGHVRLQDFAFPLGALSGSSDEGGRAVWDYFKTNYSRLQARLGRGSTLFSACVGLSSRGITATEVADEIEAFFSDPERQPGSAQRRLDQALEVVRTRISRRERDRESVAAFFNNL